MYKGLVCHGASLLVGSSTSRPPTAVGGTGEVGADGAGGAVSEVVAAVRALGLGTGQAEDYRKEHQTVKEAESHRQEEHLVLRKLKFEKIGVKSLSFNQLRYSFFDPPWKILWRRATVRIPGAEVPKMSLFLHSKWRVPFQRDLIGRVPSGYLKFFAKKN